MHIGGQSALNSHEKNLFLAVGASDTTSVTLHWSNAKAVEQRGSVCLGYPLETIPASNVCFLSNSRHGVNMFHQHDIYHNENMYIIFSV